MWEFKFSFKVTNTYVRAINVIKDVINVFKYICTVYVCENLSQINI